MVVCFILFGIIAVVAGWLFVDKTEEPVHGLIAVAISLFILGFGFIFYDNKIAETKVKTLDAVGIEYLSKEDVYNKSQAELDKLLKVVTLEGTYYYDLGEDK